MKSETKIVLKLTSTQKAKIIKALRDCGPLYEEFALLAQPFLQDNTLTVKLLNLSQYKKLYKFFKKEMKWNKWKV